MYVVKYFATHHHHHHVCSARARDWNTTAWTGKARSTFFYDVENGDIRSFRFFVFPSSCQRHLMIKRNLPVFHLAWKPLVRSEWPWPCYQNIKIVGAAVSALSWCLFFTSQVRESWLKIETCQVRRHLLSPGSYQFAGVVMTHTCTEVATFEQHLSYKLVWTVRVLKSKLFIYRSRSEYKCNELRESQCKKGIAWGIDYLHNKILIQIPEVAYQVYACNWINRCGRYLHSFDRFVYGNL